MSLASKGVTNEKQNLYLKSLDNLWIEQIYDLSRLFQWNYRNKKKFSHYITLNTTCFKPVNLKCMCSSAHSSNISGACWVCNSNSKYIIKKHLPQFFFSSTFICSVICFNIHFVNHLQPLTWTPFFSLVNIPFCRKQVGSKLRLFWHKF